MRLWYSAVAYLLINELRERVLKNTVAGLKSLKWPLN